MKKHKIKVTIRCSEPRGRSVASESVKHDEQDWYPAMGEAVADTLNHFGNQAAWCMIAHAVDSLDSLVGLPDAEDDEGDFLVQAMGDMRDAATRVMEALRKQQDDQGEPEQDANPQTKLMIEEEE